MCHRRQGMPPVSVDVASCAVLPSRSVSTNRMNCTVPDFESAVTSRGEHFVRAPQSACGAARGEDLRTELAGRFMLAATSDAFREKGSRRQLWDRIIMTAGELGTGARRWTGWSAGPSSGPVDWCGS